MVNGLNKVDPVTPLETFLRGMETRRVRLGDIPERSLKPSLEGWKLFFTPVPGRDNQP